MGQTDRDLDNDMLRRVCTVQIQPRKHLLDHAGYTAPTRQHGLDHTDQELICPAWQISIVKMEIDDLSEDLQQAHILHFALDWQQQHNKESSIMIHQAKPNKRELPLASTYSSQAFIASQFRSALRSDQDEKTRYVALNHAPRLLENGKRSKLLSSHILSPVPCGSPPPTGDILPPLQPPSRLLRPVERRLPAGGPPSVGTQQ